MNPKTCDKCGKIFSSNFCPSCSRKYEDIIKIEPIKINTYIHGNKEDGYQHCKEFGIDPDTKLGKKIHYLNYEVNIIYEIVDNKLIAKQINTGDGQGFCDIIPIKK